MTHSKLTNKIIKIVLGFGIGDPWVLNVGGGPYQRSGVPDIIFVIGGHFGAVEVKIGKDEFKPLQKREARLIRRAGSPSIGIKWEDGVYGVKHDPDGDWQWKASPLKDILRSFVSSVECCDNAFDYSHLR